MYSTVWETATVCALDAEWQPNTRVPKATLVQLALTPPSSPILILLLASPPLLCCLPLAGCKSLRCRVSHGTKSQRCDLHGAPRDTLLSCSSNVVCAEHDVKVQDLLALSQETAKAFLQTLFRSPTVLKVPASFSPLPMRCFFWCIRGNSARDPGTASARISYGILSGLEAHGA